MSRPLLLGHRGVPARHPENTLPGFQAALDAGLDGVEWDVRRLADGTLVIHHDDTLSSGELLTHLTRDEWPKYLPTLHDGLVWAADTGAFVNVELKHETPRPDDRVPRTLDAIRTHGLTRRVIVSSFMPTFLRAARRAVPEIPRGLLIHRAYPPALIQAVMAWTGSAALHPAHPLVTPSLMAQARRRGGQVNAWTVNDPADARRLSALGVHGLIGDVPAALTAARAD